MLNNSSVRCGSGTNKERVRSSMIAVVIVKINLLFITSLLLFSSVYASYPNPPPPANYATETSNFDWTPLLFYGDQNPNVTSNVIDLCYEFILTQNNTFFNLVEFNSGETKEFILNDGINFTVLPIPSIPAYSMEQIGKDSYAFGTKNSLMVYNGSQLTSFPLPTTFEYVYGLCYDGASTLYVADSVHSRVLAVNISTGELLRLYGRTNINDTTASYIPLMDTFALPSRLRLDCEGNLWVTDYLFNRIVRYKAGTTTPDLLWGQPSWTSANPSTTQNGFSLATDIVFDKTCSVAFVAERQRVLMFRAPFVSNQSAEGVLGAFDFNTKGSFASISRLQLEETGNSSGLLYVLDTTYKRIVVGRTQWSENTTLISDCSLSSAGGGQCVIQQAVTLEGAIITIHPNYSQIVIAGTLTMNNLTQLTISSQQQIQTTGDVVLAGQLTIILSAEDNAVLQQSGGIEVTVITTNSTMKGEFSGVTIEGEEQSKCGTRKEEKYTGKSMGVVLNTQTCSSGGEETGLSSGAIAGIVIGGAGAVGIVGAVLAIGAAIVGWRVKKNDKKTRDAAQASLV